MGVRAAVRRAVVRRAAPHIVTLLGRKTCSRGNVAKTLSAQGRGPTTSVLTTDYNPLYDSLSSMFHPRRLRPIITPISNFQVPHDVRPDCCPLKITRRQAGSSA
eukprot:6200760-Pleurochrysis_carterae.AAC.2